MILDSFTSDDEGRWDDYDGECLDPQIKFSL